jgi:hypothetical protein
VTDLVTREPQIREFQVVQDGPILRILVVPSLATTACDNGLETRLGQAGPHRRQLTPAGPSGIAGFGVFRDGAIVVFVVIGREHQRRAAAS